MIVPLIESGYLVESAEDGWAAWQALNTGSYHLLVTDNDMPGLYGVELLRKMRFAGMTLPVILATATLPEKDHAESACLIAHSTLLKPYTARELLRRVNEIPVVRDLNAVSHNESLEVIPRGSKDRRSRKYFPEDSLSQKVFHS